MSAHKAKLTNWTTIAACICIGTFVLFVDVPKLFGLLIIVLLGLVISFGGYIHPIFAVTKPTNISTEE